MVKCVISDLGKVILFFDNFIFFRHMAEHCPFSADDIAQLVQQHWEMIRAFDTGKIQPVDFYKKVVGVLDAKIEQKKFFPIYNNVFSTNKHVLGLMRRLKANNKMILLSNTDVERFGFIKKKFPEIFLFDDYVLSYEVGCMKPDPAIYRVALEKAGVPARECVFLDDLPENIDGARRLGMNGVLYGPQTDLESKLKQLGVVF